MSKSFPWGRVIDLFSYDFDGATMEVTKFHPWASAGITVHTGQPDESQTHYHCEELSASYDTLDALLIAWIANKRLGLNQHALVSGICRALEIGPAQEQQA